MAQIINAGQALASRLKPAMVRAIVYTAKRSRQWCAHGLHTIGSLLVLKRHMRHNVQALNATELICVTDLIDQWLGPHIRHTAAHSLQALEHTQTGLAAQRTARTQRLQALLHTGTPEAICHELLSHWTVDTRSEAQIQQRQAAVWCAILTPMVAQRSHKVQLAHSWRAQCLAYIGNVLGLTVSSHTKLDHTAPALTIQHLLDAANQWLTQQGTTAASQYCAQYAELKQLAKHPQRMYQLCLNSARQHGVSAPQLLCATVLPVMQCLCVVQTLQTLEHADTASSTANTFPARH